MTQQEFEQLTGQQVSPEKFEGINKVYMATTLDKWEFCEKWMNDKDSLAVQLAQNTSLYREGLTDESEKLDNLAAGVLARIATNYNADIVDLVRQYTSEKFVIIWKAENRVELTEDEKDYLRRNLI